jgi:3-dehydroquinate synthase
MLIVDVRTFARSYDAVVGRGVLGDLGAMSRPLAQGAAAVVCCDDNVAPLYLQKARRSLETAGFSVAEIVIPAGEDQKNLVSLELLLGQFYDLGLARRDLIVALGGGVIGDMAGFAAAVFQRGVCLVQVPTTLLAMVDASVGGKVAVDYRDGKNYVGTFYQPWLVVADLDTLATLPAREIRCGWAEMVKHALLQGDPALGLCEEGLADPESPSEVLVEANLRYKASVAARDEREECGTRAVLNLGHTIGHAVEAATGFSRYSHGEAVGLGLRAALWLSASLTGLTSGDADHGQRLLSSAGLPERLTDVDVERVVSLIARDKKAVGASVGFVLLEGPGRPVAGVEVPLALQREVVEWLAAR